MAPLRKRPITKKAEAPKDVDKIRVRSSLDAKLIRKFCTYLRMGNPPDAVCDYLGIVPGTFWTWTNRGEKFILGDCQPPRYEIFGIFVMEMRKALAEYRMERVLKLHKSQQWTRELAILERRDRKTFGKVDPQGGSFDDYQPDEKFL